VVIAATATCFAGLTHPVVVVDVTFHGLMAFRTGESVTRHGVSVEELLPSLERGTMVLPVVWVVTAGRLLWCVVRWFETWLVVRSWCSG
jgi:hypothetical protein